MPGADFAAVVRNALVSRRAGAVRAPDIAGGLLVHATLAVVGVGAVLGAVPAFFRALQLLGGASVLRLGVRALASLRGPAEGVEEPEGVAAHPLRQGFVTNVLNPKASSSLPRPDRLHCGAAAVPGGRRARGPAGPVAVPAPGRPWAPGGHRGGTDGAGSGPAAGATPGLTPDQLTRPYQTLLVQIFWRRTTSPVLGACQILLWSA
ncbi:LysE family translocator [Streptomyces lasalocidi]